LSKVRINDLARELEVKSKQILDALEAMNLAEGKTHSSSIEEGEAVRVRGYFERGSRPTPSASARVEQNNRPNIDLSSVSKPGDAMKAILARKQEAERAAQYPQRPGLGAGSGAASAPPAVVVRPPAAAASSAPASGQGIGRPAAPPRLRAMLRLLRLPLGPSLAGLCPSLAKLRLLFTLRRPRPLRRRRLPRVPLRDR